MKKQTKEKMHKDERAEGTYFSYTLGFSLSIIATIIPYVLFEYHVLSTARFIAVAIAAALIQLFVQLVLFLHLNFKRRSATNLLIFAYTIMIVGIVVAGTLWIMSNLSTNMHDTVFPDGTFTPQSAAY